MALVTCSECKSEISDRAAACPKCGAPNDGGVPLSVQAAPQKKAFKWWLWGPIALVVLFLAYGASIPKHEGEARAARRACEQMAGANPSLQYQCDKNYADAMARGAQR
jgi:hypothetical protein